MKIFFLSAFIFLSLFSSKILNAQIEVEKSKSGSNKVEVFTNEGYFDDGGRGSLDDNNLLKFDFSLLLQGEIPIFYERRFTEVIALEVAAGPTIANSFTMGFADFFGLADGMFDLFPENASSEMGMTYKAAVRFYVSADGDAEGAYLAPTIHYKTFKFRPTAYDQNGMMVEGDEVYTWTFRDFLAQGGYQYELTDNIYWDSYFGLGVRKKYLDVVATHHDNAGNRYYTKETLEKNGVGYAIGTKLGIRF